jgi:hypothetical protein
MYIIPFIKPHHHDYTRSGGVQLTDLSSMRTVKSTGAGVRANGPRTYRCNPS